MHSWAARRALASTSGRAVVSYGGDGRSLRPLQSHVRPYRRRSTHHRHNVYSGGSDRGGLSSQEEYSFSLTQYMVVLDKPIGLTLAPDPSTGHVYVQHVQQGMSAADSKLVLVGDRLLSCSAVFGDEMWHASDLQRTRWAINNRPGKVKLVLERSTGVSLPPWYFRGREGIATWEVPDLQLPVQFITPVGGELTESLLGVGKSMSVSFNRCISPAAGEQVRRPFLRPGLQARHMRVTLLTQQLSAAAAAPDVDVSLPFGRLLTGKDGARLQVNVSPTPVQADGASTVLPFRRSSNNSSSNSNNSSSSSSPKGGSNSNSIGSIPSNSSSNSTGPAAANINSSSIGANSSSSSSGDAASSSSSTGSSVGNGGSRQAGGAAAAAAAAWGGTAAPGVVKDKKVVQVLPWILVSNARLNLQELTRIATSRALVSLLELGLVVNQDGLLCPRGSQPPPFSLPAAPVPPTLSPSETPKPAPVNPPPMPPQPPDDDEQQQQQQQQVGPVVAVGAVVDDAGAVAAGLAGPDMGFAAAAAAAAAAVAGQEQQQQPQGTGGGSSSSSSGLGLSGGSGAQQQLLNPGDPSHITLQAHALLHCLADLHRMSIRCKWTARAREAWRSSSSKDSSSSSGSSSSSSSGTPPYTSPTYTTQGGIAGQGLAAGGGLGSSSSGPAQHIPQQQQQQHRQMPDSCQLLIHCDEGNWGLVGLLLVVWLHWCCGVEESAAVESVSKSLGVTLDTSVLLEVRRLLVVRAKERFSRLMLTWPYGGLSAEVSGELVGGWTERVAMKRCLKPEGCLGASQGHFYLELKGLHPGKYHYKYIIDNTWATDAHAPQALDSQGNWNNVLEVKPPPRIETPEEQAHFAALQALCMAFERKLRPVGSFFGN